MEAREKRFLTAEWRYLAMLNYKIDPGLLERFVPAGTELDSWEGVHYVSVIGFLFLKTRVMGVPIPFHRDFEEVNLRFYVRRKGPEGWRRGVVFVKEIVPRAAVATLARALFNENYVTLQMGHEMKRGETMGVGYWWEFQGTKNFLRVATSGEASVIGEGSFEEFITEHHWGYTKQRDGGTLEYEVEHPRWRVWQVAEAELKCDAEKLYGTEFGNVLTGKPASAFLAEGSESRFGREKGLPDQSLKRSAMVSSNSGKSFSVRSSLPARMYLRAMPYWVA